MASNFFQDYQDNVAKDLKRVDENLLVGVKASIDSTNQLLSLEEDLNNVNQLRDAITNVEADVWNHVEHQKFRDAIVKKLDSLVAVEEAAVSAIRTRMLTKVKADVVSSFNSDAKTKEKALEQAISILNAGVGAKRGKDIVGEVFAKSINAYRENYAKKPASEDPIIVQFEKDVAAIAQAPSVTTSHTPAASKAPHGGKH